MNGPRDREDGVALPAETAWPMVTAFGVALIFAGLVTLAAVTVVGAVLAAAGAIGWAREVYPRPREELVPLAPPALRARPVAVAPQEVELLRVGEDGHRVRLPEEIHPYSAGLRGGLAGAAAMAAVAVAYGLVAQRSPWFPINLLASAVSPPMMEASTEMLRAFHAGPLAVATVIHLVLSTFAGLVYAAVLPMLPGRSMLWGGVVAPVLWSGVVFLALRIVSPTMDAHVSWPWFVGSQLAYGLACGAVVARTARVETLQLWPLVLRARVESPGLRGDDEGRP